MTSTQKTLGEGFENPNVPMLADIITCGRCKKFVDPEQSESCWFCISLLCYDCWEELGHCGHRETEITNKVLRGKTD